LASFDQPEPSGGGIPPPDIPGPIISDPIIPEGIPPSGGTQDVPGSTPDGPESKYAPSLGGLKSSARATLRVAGKKIYILQIKSANNNPTTFLTLFNRIFKLPPYLYKYTISFYLNYIIQMIIFLYVSNYFRVLFCLSIFRAIFSLLHIIVLYDTFIVRGDNII
jgi:hypothetical protein